MKVKLEEQTKYFCTTETEATSLVEDVKRTAKGDIKKSLISQKEHKDYGKYFEVAISEQFTTSKSILEKGV